MSSTMLQRIAEAMRAETQQTGQPATHELSGGLILTLCGAGDAWMLVLHRDDVPPSATEIATCRRDFAVPADAQETTTARLTTLCWTEPMPAIWQLESEQLALV